MPSSQAHDTNLPTLLVTKPTRGLTTLQHVHPYGTRSKTQANTMILQSSSEDETEDHQHKNHPWRIQQALESWVTCLTAFQQNYGSKQVAC